ncbi:MAG: DUF1491 family protein [Hyphomicrobium sp.]
MRLKSEFWVKAYIRRCMVNDAAAVVVRHGDDDAGAIYIKISRLDGTAALFGPAPAGLSDADYERRWVAHFDGAFCDDASISNALEKEQRFDSDLWIIEVEDRQGRHFLDAELLSPRR